MSANAAGQRQLPTIGIYLDTSTVVNDPAYVDALQRDAGLNLVILMGGYTLSPAATALNPLREEGHGPGFSWDADGRPLEQAIGILHERGIKAWLLFGCWQIGGEKYPNLVARDMLGKPLTDYPPFPYCSEQRSLTFCPSNEEINAFYAAAYADAVRQYPLDGIDITHARYTSPAFWPAVFSCACERCQAQAESLGYDFERMRADSLATVEALQRLDATALKRFVEPAVGLGDFLQSVAGRRGLVEWLDWRAEMIGRNIKRFHAAVHEAAAGRDVTFGVDNFPPSVALFAGHCYANFMSACDWTTPLLSHPAYFVLATIQSWAHTLRSWVQGLSERQALEVVYQVLGFEGLPLPREIDALGTGFPESEPGVPGLEELVRHDLVKSRLYNTGQVPSYPVLMGGLWPRETVQRLVADALEMGHEGVIYQLSDAITSYRPRA